MVELLDPCGAAREAPFGIRDAALASVFPPVSAVASGITGITGSAVDTDNVSFACVFPPVSAIANGITGSAVDTGNVSFARVFPPVSAIANGIPGSAVDTGNAALRIVESSPLETTNFFLEKSPQQEVRYDKQRQITLKIFEQQSLIHVTHRPQRPLPAGVCARLASTTGASWPAALFTGKDIS